MKKLILIVFVFCSSILFGQKISELPSATTIQNENLLPIVQSGVTKKITYSNLIAPIDVPAIDSAYVVGDSLLIITYFNKDNDSVYYARSIDNNWTRISGDSIFVTNGSITDTLILIAGATDLEGLSDVDLTTPDAFDILMLDDESMLWKNRSFSSLMTESPEGTWVRDTANGYIYQATLTDKVGIGTDSPDYDFEVSNTAKIGDTLWLGTSYFRPATIGLYLNANSGTAGFNLSIAGTNYYRWKTNAFTPASDLLTNLGDDGQRFNELWTKNIVDYSTGLYFNAPVVEDDSVFASSLGVVGKMKATKELEDLSDVDLTTPDAFDILMLDDESMLWKNRSFSSLMAESPEGTWVRDTTNGWVYLANLPDFVGIGTDTPTLALEVYGGTLIRDQFSVRDGADQEMIFVDATGSVYDVGTYISMRDSTGFEGPAYFDQKVNFGTHAEIEETTTKFIDDNNDNLVTIHHNDSYVEIGTAATLGLATLAISKPPTTGMVPRIFDIYSGGSSYFGGIARYGYDDHSTLLDFDYETDSSNIVFPLNKLYDLDNNGTMEVILSVTTSWISGQIIMNYEFSMDEISFTVQDSTCKYSSGNLSDSIFIASPRMDADSIIIPIYSRIKRDPNRIAAKINSYNNSNQVTDNWMTYSCYQSRNYNVPWIDKYNQTPEDHYASWAKDTTNITSTIVPTMAITTAVRKAIYLKGNAPYVYANANGITEPTDSTISFPASGLYQINIQLIAGASTATAMKYVMVKNDNEDLTSISAWTKQSNAPSMLGFTTIAEIEAGDYLELKSQAITTNITLSVYSININITRIR